MTSIEVFFGVIIFIFALIGLVRGFLRELGVTLVMMFLLFFLSQFEPYLEKGLGRVVSLAGRLSLVKNPDVFKAYLFLFVIIGAAFVSYEGETLKFEGESLRGTQGVLLGALTGLLNGYLIAGSIWFYLNKFNYPIAFLGFSSDKLSKAAQTMIDFLPINFLGQEVFLGQSLLLYLSVLLLMARVIR